MAATYNGAEKDVLRQECLEILRSYMPKKSTKKDLMPPVQTKKQVRSKNEAYVQSMENVMQVDRDVAIQRNKQAFEEFMQNLAYGPAEVVEPVKGTRTVIKRKTATPKFAAKAPKVRKVKGKKVLPEQEFYAYPTHFQQQQPDFRQQFNQTFNQTFNHPSQFDQSFDEPEQFNQTLPDEPSEIDLYETFQF